MRRIRRPELSNSKSSGSHAKRYQGGEDFESLLFSEDGSQSEGSPSFASALVLQPDDQQQQRYSRGERMYANPTHQSPYSPQGAALQIHSASARTFDTRRLQQLAHMDATQNLANYWARD